MNAINNIIYLYYTYKIILHLRHNILKKNFVISIKLLYREKVICLQYLLVKAYLFIRS